MKINRLFSDVPKRVFKTLVSWFCKGLNTIKGLGETAWKGITRAIKGFASIPKRAVGLWKKIPISLKVICFGLVIGLMAVGSLRVALGLSADSRDFWKGFFSDLGTSLLGIAITVLVLDRVYERRQEAQLKERLIRQLRSTDRDFAVSASEELKVHRWGFLKDESLVKAYLRGANLRGANLWYFKLNGADLRSANLRGVNLNNAHLSDADLRGANLYNANLSDADLRRAKLSGVKLSNADLGNADLGNTNLRGNDLSGANLSGANLWRADLRDANLSGADLSDADLSYTELRGANLCGADLGSTQLRRARYDANTLWPLSFDPKAAGAIKPDETIEPASNEVLL